MKKNILFSAPSKFFEIKKNNKFNIFFKEISILSEIPYKKKINGWIVNPGQKFTINKEILSSFKELEVIVTPSTGTNHINLKDCKKRGIKVLSLLNDRKALNKIRASSEFSFFLILNSLRKLQNLDAEITSRRWRKKENKIRGEELFEKKVGIIGLGRIGMNVAKWCSSFGCHVSYYDPNVNTNKYKKTNLNNIFKNNDIILISCFLNEETNKMINYNHLKLLKKGSHLINTSRGEVINQAHLLKFLNKTKNVNVSCDVLENEVYGKPLTNEIIQLYKKKKIFLTPHVAGATYESQIKAADISINLIKKFYEKN